LSRSRAAGKGPKPIVGWKPDDEVAPPGSDVDVLPPDFRGWVGPQRLDRNRHYMGSDGHGPTLKFLPPKVPRAPRQPPEDPGLDGP
jgi:hypothetical protein